MASESGWGLKAYPVRGPLCGAKVYTPLLFVSVSNDLDVVANFNFNRFCSAIFAGHGFVEKHDRVSNDFPVQPENYTNWVFYTNQPLEWNPLS